MNKKFYLWVYFTESEYSDTGWIISAMVRGRPYEECKGDKYLGLSEGQAFLKEVEVDVDLPSFDAVDLLKGSLEKQLEKLKADYAAGKAVLEEKLSQLTAIEHKEEQ